MFDDTLIANIFFHFCESLSIASNKTHDGGKMGMVDAKGRKKITNKQTKKKNPQKIH